jgi:hypothetical protein
VNGLPAGLTVRGQEPGPALVEMNVLQAELQMNNAKAFFVIQVIFGNFLFPGDFGWDSKLKIRLGYLYFLDICFDPAYLGVVNFKALSRCFWPCVHSH